MEPKTWVLSPQVFQLVHQWNGSNKTKKGWLSLLKKFSIESTEVDLSIFDTKLFFNTYPRCLCCKEGWMCHSCCKAVPRQSLWGFVKSCFNLFWKSVSYHRKSNHTVLCKSCLENPSVSFNMEILLAPTLPSSAWGKTQQEEQPPHTCHPGLLKYNFFPPFLCLNLVFWWFADTSQASHINSNSMTRCLLGFSHHPLQP